MTVIYTCSHGQRHSSLVHYLQHKNTQFVKPSMWSPNSPLLNLLDYVIWSALQQMRYHQRSFASVDELRTETNKHRCMAEIAVVFHQQESQ